MQVHTHAQQYCLWALCRACRLMYRLLAAGIPRSRMFVEQVVITAAGKPHKEFDEEHTEWFDFGE